MYEAGQGLNYLVSSAALASYYILAKVFAPG